VREEIGKSCHSWLGREDSYIKTMLLGCVNIKTSFRHS